MPDKKALQALAAAGRKLKIEPETFSIRMGEIEGLIVNIDFKAEKNKAIQVVSDGRVSQVPVLDTYKSTMEIKWLTTDPAMLSNIKDTLTEMGKRIAARNREMIQLQYGEESDIDYFGTARE
jgi:hypothetical protein